MENSGVNNGEGNVDETGIMGTSGALVVRSIGEQKTAEQVV